VNILRDTDAPNRMYGMACSPLVIEPILFDLLVDYVRPLTQHGGDAASPSPFHDLPRCW
jgi:hypothetical protein